MNTRVRTRYLMAMGLLSPAMVSLAGCRRTATPEPGIVLDDAASPPVTASAVASASASASTRVAADAGTATQRAVRVVRRDAGAGYWLVDEAREERASDAPVAPRPSMPSCPSGTFCVAASALDAGAPNALTHAPAPYGACPAVVRNAPPGIVRGPSVAFHAPLTERERAARSDACCYSWSEPCPGGRPLRDEGGVPCLAGATRRDDWTPSGASEPFGDDDAQVARLARHWLAEAAAEHASIASFHRFALQLLALGAPPELLLAAGEAARDEIRHAEACYGLASRLTGERHGPGRLPIPSTSLALDPGVVARETLRDGCLGETLAARSADEAASRTADPFTADVLARIAADEESHAALAWRTVAWLLAVHGEPIRAEIADVLAEVNASLARDPRPGATTPADPDEVHGRLGVERQARVRSEALRTIVVPCLEALLAASPLVGVVRGIGGRRGGAADELLVDDEV